MGLFAGGDPASKASELSLLFQKDWGVPPDPHKPWDDLYLLSYDTKRVWQGDPEASVAKGENVYVEVLKEWSRISGDPLRLTELSEDWESDKGPITVSLLHGGKTAILRPAYLDDWLDLDLLKQINVLIEAENKMLTYAVNGNFSIVCAVTPDEANQIRKDRGLPLSIL